VYDGEDGVTRDEEEEELMVVLRDSFGLGAEIVDWVAVLMLRESLGLGAVRSIVDGG